MNSGLKSNKFIILFNFLNKNSNFIKKDKKTVLKTLLIACCFLPFIAILCFSLVMLTKACLKSSVLPELIVLLTTSVQLFQFFFILRTFPAEFFAARDNEFYASLPISHNCIFWAKFLKYYLHELVFSTLLLAPFLFTVIGTALSNNYVFTVGFYFMLIPLFITTPLMPILLTAIFSLPINALSSFFKKRGAVSSVLSIIIYLGVMVAYFFIVPKLETIGEGFALSEQAVTSLKTASKVFYFTQCEVFTAIGIEVGKNFGIGISIFAAFFCVAILMSTLTFKRSLTAGSESASESKNGKSLSFKTHSKILALMSRDFKQVIRVPSMALNTFATAFLSPLFLIIMYFMGLQNSFEGVESSLSSTAFLLMYAMLITPSTNTSSSLAFSREGKAFAFFKQLPVSSEDIIKSKLLFSCILSALSTIIIMIVGIAMYNISPLETLLVGISLFSVCVAMNVVGLYCDSKKPNFNWNSISEISRRSRSQLALMIPFFICIGFSIALFAFGIFLSTLSASGVLGVTISKVIFWAVAASLSVFASLGVVFTLIKKIKLNIEKITQEDM